MYKGKAFRIKKDGKTIFHETDFKLSSSLDFSEIASKDTDGKEFVAKDIEWTISCNSLIADSDSDTQIDAAALYADHIGKTLVALEFTNDTTGEMVFSGNAYVSQFDLDSTYDDVVKGSFSFKGTGTLAIATVSGS